MGSDQEINEAVARKLGWIQNPNPSYKSDMQKPWINQRRKCDLLPDYCNDIKAAWEIVEHLSTLGSGYWVKFWSSPSGFTFQINYADNDKELSVSCDLAPMAICLAFLKLQ